MPKTRHDISLNAQRFGTVLPQIAGEPMLIHCQNALYTQEPPPQYSAI